MRHTYLLSRSLTIFFLFSVILSSTLNASAQTCAPAPSGLVSWWKGEGNASDSVGANNGTPQNGISFAAGEVGQGFSLDGRDDFVNIPDSNSIDAITSAISVEAWIRPEAPTATWGFIFGNRDPNFSEKFSVAVYGDGKIGVIIRTANTNIGPNGVTWASAPGVIKVGQWQHIAATYVSAPGQLNIYVNGQAQSLTLIDGPNALGGDLVGVNNLFIGRRQDLNDIFGIEGAFGAAYYKGLIDELSLYNRSLSASEIQAIFNAGSAGKCKTTTTQQRPLIFIPGIAGSKLNSAVSPNFNIWPNSPLDYSTLTLKPREIQAGVIIPDVIRDEPLADDIYKSLLDSLIDPNRGGYIEYLVGSQPSKRTRAGCDLSQKRSDPSQNPNLFVFAYDWRISNIENVASLNDYIGCVRQFYGNDTKIDILTHSMGGLLARRYMLVHPNDPSVGKFITLSSPWLGAPKAINVLETGAFLDGKLKQAITNSLFKKLSEYYPGVHELLPSESYFALNGRPFALDNHVINNYDSFVNIMNLRFPFSNPGTAGKAFHGRAGQDDERVSPSAAQTFHFYGIRPSLDTIGKIFISTQCVRLRGGCVNTTKYDYLYTPGDITVPRLSARRGYVSASQPGLNELGATVREFSDANADLVSHTGITRNTLVQSAVIGALRSPLPTQSQAATSLNVAADESDEVPAQLAYYVSILGTNLISLTDSSGHSTNPFSDPPDQGILGASTYITSSKSADIIVPLDQQYTVTFQTGADPLSVSITRGADQTDQAIRYQDLNLPARVTARIRLTPQGVEGLAFDSDGNGTFDVTVQPTASVVGAAAQDVTPPSVAISAISQGASMLVTITAADSESGVKTVTFSQDGVNFATYTGPFTVNPLQGPVVFAFADDNVANRSGIVTHYPSPTANQVDNAQFFVRQHYLDFLNREPDSSGLGFWTNEITSCGGDAPCREVKRINVSAAYFLSIEFQETGYLAYRAYKAAFGNIQGKPVPITREEMLPDAQQIGQGVVVGVGDWQQRLEQNKRAFFDQLVTRERFTTLYPQAMSPEQFVDALNANAGGALSQAERDALVGELKSNAKTRAQVLRAVAEDADLTRAETNKAFVLMQYFGYLRRNPDNAPDANFGGWQFWLGKLDQFNGDFVKAEMVKAFITSTEYRQRFSAN